MKAPSESNDCVLRRGGGVRGMRRVGGSREKCLYVAEDPVVSPSSRPSLLPDPPPLTFFSSTHFLHRYPRFALIFHIRTSFKMLEAFEILTTSGVVLWSKSYAPVGSHVINSLINDVFIEEKVAPQSVSTTGASPTFKKEKYTLKWKQVKEFNLIFVVRPAYRMSIVCRMTDHALYRLSTNLCSTLDGLTNSWKTSRRFSPTSTRISS